MLANAATELLGCGIEARAFIEEAELAFINAATPHCKLANGRPNLSAIAVATGLQRRRVASILSSDRKFTSNRKSSKSVVQSLIDGWRCDKNMLLSNGHPRDLEIEGDGVHSVCNLVRLYGRDSPPQAATKELLRRGLAQRLPNGKLRLKR
jgi:hypothetical protein